MIKRLWGDSFFKKEGNRWTNKSDGGKNKRGFVAFILDPIYQLFDAIMTEKADKVERMLKTLGVTLKGEEKDLKGKPLLKRVMQKWLPAGDAVLEMIVLHLPSPRDAQKYRTPLLYEGPEVRVFSCQTNICGRRNFCIFCGGVGHGVCCA